jgi:hypothetical protein
MSDIDYKAKYFQLVRKVTIQNTYVLQIEKENKEQDQLITLCFGQFNAIRNYTQDSKTAKACAEYELKISEHKAVPIRDHPLKNEIFEKLRNGEIVLS